MERMPGALGPPMEAHAGSSVAAFQQSLGLPGTDRSTIVAKARQVLIEEAQRDRDDPTLKRLLEKNKRETGAEKHSRTDIAKVLAQKAQEESEALEKRRKENLENTRRHALDLEARKEEVARLQIAAEERRQETIKKSLEMRREEQKRAEPLLHKRDEARWLQVEFPVELARRCMDWYSRALSHADKRTLELTLRDLHTNQVCKRRPIMRDL